MALPININNLINKSTFNKHRIEFFEYFIPNSIIHTICAFANDIDNVGGGYIIVGVEEENGSPVFPIKGIEQNKIDSILQDLLMYCHLIEPLYNPVVEPVLYQKKYIIVIWVPGGYSRPYKVSKDVFTEKSNKLYYIRKFSSTIIASSEEEKQLFYVSTDIPFDDRPNLLASIDDLDIMLIRQHLQQVGNKLYDLSFNSSILEVAKSMHLVTGPTENIKPLNVGILMFGKNPGNYFRYARIEVVNIPDPTSTNMIEQTFTGPIQFQLQNALNYIKGIYLQEAIIKVPNQAESIRISNYPYEVIEELLANAVYHRSYQIYEPITVRITPNSITITSFPGFDNSISDKDISEYNITSHIYRNRRIGDFLKELHLIEGRNTGYPMIINSLKKNGSPLPIFKMDENRTYLSVTLPIHPYFKKDDNNDKNIIYKEKIKEALNGKVLSLRNLAKEMGYKGISKKLSNEVEKMILTKEIIRVIDGSSIKLSLPKYNQM